MSLKDVIKSNEDKKYSAFLAECAEPLTKYITAGRTHFFCHGYCGDTVSRDSVPGYYYNEFLRWLDSEGINYTINYNSFGSRSVNLHS